LRSRTGPTVGSILSAIHASVAFIFFAMSSCVKRRISGSFPESPANTEMFRFAQHDSAITRWDCKRCVGVRDDSGKMVYSVQRLRTYLRNKYVSRGSDGSGLGCLNCPHHFSTKLCLEGGFGRTLALRGAIRLRLIFRFTLQNVCGPPVFWSAAGSP